MTFTIDTTTWRSPNFEPRDQASDAIVLHTGEGTRKSDLQTLTYKNPVVKRRVSSGYYVCRDGTIYQLVDDKNESYHAGVSSYAGRSNWNEFSIGIETEHKKGQDWPQVQKDALAWLCRLLITRHGIKQSMIAAHRWIAPGRKLDPSDWPDESLRAWIAGLYTAAPTPTPVGYSFRAPPRISRRTFAAILTRFISPMTALADELYTILEQNSIDPAWWLAMVGKESTYATRGRSASWFNPANVRSAADPTLATGTVKTVDKGIFTTYPGFENAVLDWCKRMNGPKYAGDGRFTPERVIPRYAPDGDGENNEREYIDFMNRHIEEYLAEDKQMPTKPDVEQAWGTAAPFVRGHGIPDAYEREYNEGRESGPILGPEQDFYGWTLQPAQKDLYVYKDGQTTVVKR